MDCCPSKHRLPSLPRQVVNVAKALATTIAHGAKTGQLAASAEVIEKRLKTCQGCSKFTGERCRECGCFIAAKAALAASTCPLTKW